jgi:acetyl esterase
MGEYDFLRNWTDWLKMPDLSQLDLTGSVQTLRQSFFRASRSIEPDLPDLAEISNLLIDGADGPLKARLYVPRGAGIAPAPAIVFFHGGGFVLGDLDSHDVVCRRLADGSKCRVLSVDYRLAPEHKFPTARRIGGLAMDN